jgi:CubicO group peptidase (beta-lactamase class C family)
MNRARIVALALLAVAWALPSFAQKPGFARPAALDPARVKAVDAFIAKAMAERKIPGMAVGIYSRGEILLAKGYGLANVELNVPVKPETVFQTGSVGKQFVSAAIMMLVEEGKVSLDDSVTKYFPEAPASWKPILLRNLLSHTSGLAEYESDDRTGPNGPFYMRLDFTENELVTKVEALPIDFAAGEKWDYRNTNYFLLGVLIHKVTGKPYYEFLNERIFKPLGMRSTRLDTQRDIIPDRAAGYELVDGALKNQDWVSPTFNSTADGTLYSTVLDMAKWDAELYGTQLLKQSSLDRIWTVFSLNNGEANAVGYGFAWMIGNQNGHKRIEHGGAWAGYTCKIARYPDDGLTIVVLTNLDAEHASVGPMPHMIAGLVEDALMPAKLAPIADAKPEIQASLAKVLDQLAASGGEISAPIFPDKKTVQARVAKLWPGGTLALVKLIPAENTGGEPTRIYRLSKTGDALLLGIDSDSSGKISRVHMAPDREYDW